MADKQKDFSFESWLVACFKGEDVIVDYYIHVKPGYIKLLILIC